MFAGSYLPFLSCPNCSSNNCRRSHRRNMCERAFSWVGIRPFRCLECDGRFWKIGDQLGIQDDRAPLKFYFLYSLLSWRVMLALSSLLKKKDHEDDH
jgi:hypothetical protein